MTVALRLLGMLLGIVGGWSLVYGLITMHMGAAITGVIMAIAAILLIAST